MPPWCDLGGTAPAFVGKDGTGRCGRCGRRVRLLSSGRLRRHRVESQVTFAEGVPARMPPPTS